MQRARQSNLKCLRSASRLTASDGGTPREPSRRPTAEAEASDSRPRTAGTAAAGSEPTTTAPRTNSAIASAGLATSSWPPPVVSASQRAGSEVRTPEQLAQLSAALRERRPPANVCAMLRGRLSTANTAAPPAPRPRAESKSIAVRLSARLSSSAPRSSVRDRSSTAESGGSPGAAARRARRSLRGSKPPVDTSTFTAVVQAPGQQAEDAELDMHSDRSDAGFEVRLSSYEATSAETSLHATPAPPSVAPPSARARRFRVNAWRSGTNLTGI